MMISSFKIARSWLHVCGTHGPYAHVARQAVARAFNDEFIQRGVPYYINGLYFQEEFPYLGIRTKTFPHAMMGFLKKILN